MMISSRGRYALRVMVDLAENCKNDGAYIPLRDIADRQEISLKYLESIMTILSRAGLVESAHGKGGGYRPARKPDQYTAGEILRLTEGSIAPVSCLKNGSLTCGRAQECRTLPVWKKLNSLICDYLDNVTIDELTGKK